MAKPRIIIADRDISFIGPVQLKFAEDYYDKLEIEVITDVDYFDSVFSTPQQAAILIVSEEFYSLELQRHNITHVFLMTEQYDEDKTADLTVKPINKYTSIKEIFNLITGMAFDVFASITGAAKQETQVILMYSASGGSGKTTAAIGVAASLTKNYKRVLYINASRLQCFQHHLDNKTPITSSEIYAKLMRGGDDLYDSVKYAIRKELFSYLPPFKSALMSLDLKFSVYAAIIKSAKKSGDYDFIIVDTDTAFDEDKAILLDMADKVVVITRQSRASVSATNTLVANINGVKGEKYIFICNDFDKNEDNALIAPDLNVKFIVNDYIDHFRHYDRLNPEDLSGESSIQRLAFLII